MGVQCIECESFNTAIIETYPIDPNEAIQQDESDSANEGQIEGIEQDMEAQVYRDDVDSDDGADDEDNVDDDSHDLD
jgi:hypothetical protein